MLPFQQPARGAEPEKYLQTTLEIDVCVFRHLNKMHIVSLVNYYPYHLGILMFL